MSKKEINPHDNPNKDIEESNNYIDWNDDTFSEILEEHGITNKITIQNLLKFISTDQHKNTKDE